MGLAVLIPILIHIFLNLKMICGMCKNFRKVPWNIKICLIVDILLFLIFAWMGIRENIYLREWEMKAEQ